MIKDYNKTLTIIDATTGDIITTIKCRLFSLDTISNQIKDIFKDDYCNQEHGLLLKLGIEP